MLQEVCQELDKITHAFSTTTISRKGNLYLKEHARVPRLGKIGVETLDERVETYTRQQNGRFCRASMPRRWGMYRETVS